VQRRHSEPGPGQVPDVDPDPHLRDVTGDDESLVVVCRCQDGGLMTVTRARPRARPLWVRHGAYRRLLLGASTSAAGTGVAAVALPVLAVSVFSASPRMIGLLEAAVWTPWLVVGLPAGAWVDRWSPRLLVMVADALSAVLFAGVPVLAAFDALRMWQLVVLALAAGTASVVSEAAAAVLPPWVVENDDLEAANAGVQGAESATDVLSPALSSALTHLFGLVSAFTANAVSFAVSALCLLSLRTKPAVSADPATRSLTAEVAEGLRLLFGHPTLRRLAGTAGAFNATLTGVGTLQALLLIDVVGVPPAAVGVLLVGEGVGGIAGAAVAPALARRLGSGRALALVPIVTFPFGLLTALTTRGAGLALFVAGTAVPTLGVVCTNVLMRTVRQRSAPRALLGRVSASSQVVARSAAPIVALVSGTAAAAIGVRPTIAAFWVLALAAAALLILRPPSEAERDTGDQPLDASHRAETSSPSR